MSLCPPKHREVKDHRRLISDYRMERYHFSVRDALSLYVYKWEVQKHTFCPDGVMEAYLSYIQMVVVRFHLGVQKLGCKSRSDTAT